MKAFFKSFSNIAAGSHVQGAARNFPSPLRPNAEATAIVEYPSQQAVHRIVCPFINGRCQYATVDWSEEGECTFGRQGSILKTRTQKKLKNGNACWHVSGVSVEGGARSGNFLIRKEIKFRCAVIPNRFLLLIHPWVAFFLLSLFKLIDIFLITIASSFFSHER